MMAGGKGGKSVKLKYVGMDSWDRPVYEDENGVLIKDVNPGKYCEPKLCTALNNSFDGEPDIPYHEAPEFVPERITWSW